MEMNYERDELNVEDYDLGDHSRSIHSIGSSTRSLHNEIEINEIQNRNEIEEERKKEEDFDIYRSTSWGSSREEVNHSLYTSYSNGSIFESPKYLPNINSTLPPRGTFTRDPWHSNQSQIPKSPSLLFTVCIFYFFSSTFLLVFNFILFLGTI